MLRSMTGFGAAASEVGQGTQLRIEVRSVNHRHLTVKTRVPDSFAEHMQMMFDLQVLAFQSDMTRVFSFKLSRDSSGRVFPESGSEKGFHPASHHGDNREAVLEFAKINKYHVSMLPYLLDKLKASEEADAVESPPPPAACSRLAARARSSVNTR